MLDAVDRSFLRWIYLAGHWSQSVFDDHIDPQVLRLEEDGYLRMEYFGSRKTGPLQKWVLTEAARKECEVK